jgi:hypothetical protein
VFVTALAFIVGHISFKLYIPLWLLNALLMWLATQALLKNGNHFSKSIAWCLIIPWMLIAVFGGMGPPPETATAWAALAVEQILRYTILIFAGLITAVGFFRMNAFLAKTKGRIFARLGTVLIAVAIPLFIVNMAYWGYYLQLNLTGSKQ